MIDSYKECKTIHYQRQFLAPEQDRYDEGNCQSSVYLTTFDDAEGDWQVIEAALRISDGRDCADFDFAKWDDEHADEFLAMITKLMEQVIAFRQGFAEALSIRRGQGQTSGGTLYTVTNKDVYK